MSLDELEALAKAAAPEHWAPDGQLRGAMHSSWHFILACSPQNILALIACVRAADALRHAPWQTLYPTLTTDYDTARARLDVPTEEK